jgi:hypothetical protein
MEIVYRRNGEIEKRERWLRNFSNWGEGFSAERFSSTFCITGAKRSTPKLGLKLERRLTWKSSPKTALLGFHVDALVNFFV